jgi:hypothetical protein
MQKSLGLWATCSLAVIPRVSESVQTAGDRFLPSLPAASIRRIPPLEQRAELRRLVADAVAWLANSGTPSRPVRPGRYHPPLTSSPPPRLSSLQYQLRNTERSCRAPIQAGTQNGIF